MSLNLPTPIDLALLNERIEAWLNALVASYQARYPNDDVAERYALSIDTTGRRYWRVVMANYGQRSVHAFVDSTTGDVLKAAGWKAPAKGVRYRLLDDESFASLLTSVDPFGSYLYIR